MTVKFLQGQTCGTTGTKIDSPARTHTSPSTMSHTNYSITVTFIRANNAGDDVAKFTPDDNGDLHMTMRFGNTSNGKPIFKTAVMDADDLYSWFHSTFRLVDADYEPFDSYQFDFPLMPSVLINHRELHHHYETIMNAVEFHLTNWVKNDIVNVDSDSEDEECTHQTSKHQFFDSDSDSDSSLEEESYNIRRKRAGYTG
jgi:hypothetical protein